MDSFQIGDTYQPFKSLVYPAYLAAFLLVGYNTGINQLQYFLQVMILCFALTADELKSCIDLVKAFTQRLQFIRCFAYIKMARKVAVMYGFYKLTYLILCFFLEADKV